MRVLRGRGVTSEKPKILVDTTFLLPALGIEVESEAMEAIRAFPKFEIYYLEHGILEAMWKILRIVPEENLDIVRVGLEAIRNTYNHILPPPTAYIEAYETYHRGHNDYIDTLHYTTAKHTGIPLLTIDEELLEFLRENNYPTDGIVYTPKTLPKLIR